MKERGNGAKADLGRQFEGGEGWNLVVGKDRWRGEMTEKSYLMRARRRFIIGIAVFVAAMLIFPLLIFLQLSRLPAPAVSRQSAIPLVADSPKPVSGKTAGEHSHLPITEAGP